MNDQREFFRDVEREYWAQAEGLKDAERGLIARCLDPAVATLDAGTGGGRIARALAALGFRDVTGFDFAPELVSAARAAGPETIRFDVADATALPYGDAAFGQAVYLQQVISTIGEEAGRTAALREAARVLEPGGIALFSFVCFDSRMASRAQRAYVGYLRGLRALRRSARPIQSMPRLRLQGRLDPGALRDAGPYNWWYRAVEAAGALASAGMEVEGAAFDAGAARGELCESVQDALAGGADGTLYVVARKPRASDSVRSYPGPAG